MAQLTCPLLPSYNLSDAKTLSQQRRGRRPVGIGTGRSQEV